MSLAEPRPVPKAMTAEKLMTLPDDGVERDILEGQFREKSMIRRNKAAFYDGAPALAVEILSPSDTVGDLVEKVGLDLEVGTVVWVVNPHFRTVEVHRPGQEPVTFNATQEIAGGPELPGFVARVADFFA